MKTKTKIHDKRTMKKKLIGLAVAAGIGMAYVAGRNLQADPNSSNNYQIQNLARTDYGNYVQFFHDPQRGVNCYFIQTDHGVAINCLKM